MVETADGAYYDTSGNLLNASLGFTLQPCNTTAAWTYEQYSGVASSPFGLVDVVATSSIFQVNNCTSTILSRTPAACVDAWYMIEPYTERFVSMEYQECLWALPNGSLSYESGPCSGYRPTNTYDFTFNATASSITNPALSHSWPVTPRSICAITDSPSVMLEILPIAQTCLSVEGGTVATVTCDPTQPYQSFFMTTDPATNEAYMESIMQLGTCLSAAPVPMIVPALQGPPQLGPRSDSASSLDLYNCQSAFPPNAMSQLWQGRTDGFVVSDASSNIYEMFENGTVKVFYIEPAFGGAVMTNVKCDEFCVAISKQGHIYGWNDTVPFLVSSSVFLDIAPVE